MAADIAALVPADWEWPGQYMFWRDWVTRSMEEAPFCRPAALWRRIWPNGTEPNGPRLAGRGPRCGGFSVTRIGSMHAMITDPMHRSIVWRARPGSRSTFGP